MAQCCPGDDLVLFAALIAISLARGLDAETMNILANLYCAIGDNLAIIAARREAGQKQDSC